MPSLRRSVEKKLRLHLKSDTRVPILFEDTHFCIVDKPAGSVVYKTPGAEKSLILLQLLRDQLKKRVYPVHRLDNGTSGCLVFALSSEAALGMQTALSDLSTSKKYLALVRGQIDNRGTFDRPLKNEKGVTQPAVTHYRVVKRFEQFCLVELKIETGRRHQIRRHLSFVRHQIVGDVNHGKGWLNRRFREKYNFHRMFLHCHELSFRHPFTGENIEIQSPLPKPLGQLLSQLTPVKDI